MFYLNMVDYPVFFPLLTTLTWDTSLALMGSQGWYLNHLGPLSPSESFRVGWCVGGWPIRYLWLAQRPNLDFGLGLGLGLFDIMGIIFTWSLIRSADKEDENQGGDPDTSNHDDQ